MDFVQINTVINGFCHYSFWYSLKLSQIWPGRAPFIAFFCPFEINLLSHENFPTFRHDQFLRHELYFPWLRSGISHFFKKFWFLLVENDIKKLNMAAACIFIFTKIIPI